MLDVDLDRMLHDDALADECLELLDRHGVLVFRELHLDDETQIAFSRQAGPGGAARSQADGAEIFRVTLDPAKNPAADYLKGTFDWHIDGMTDDIPIMATVLERARGRRERVATPSSRARTRRTRTCPTTRRSGRSTRRSCTRSRPRRSCRHPNPSHDDSSLEQAAAEGRTRWCGSTRTAGSRWCSAPRPTTWRAWSPRRGRASLADLLDRSTVPERVYRHEWAIGDLVIWDNRGVLHRATRYDPTSARDMHRTTIAGNEAVQ